MILSILASVAAVYLATSATRGRLRYIRRNRFAFDHPDYAEFLTWVIGFGGGGLLLVAIWTCVG